MDGLIRINHILSIEGFNGSIRRPQRKITKKVVYIIIDA